MRRSGFLDRSGLSCILIFMTNQEDAMTLTFFEKMKLTLYQKGFKGFGPAILAKLPVGSPEWFQIVDETIQSTDLDLRKDILARLLHADTLKPGPRKKKFMSIIFQLLEKGTIDEKREIVTFILKNPALFDASDEMLMGRLTVAQRESDPRIANTAEQALKILRGDQD